MSEEKKTSQLNKLVYKHKHRKNHFAVIPYILTPIIFVLISLIVVIPVGVHLMNIAIDTVHSAQETLAIDYNDISANDNYDTSLGEPSPASKIGTVSCEAAGLNADVYYGKNRVSLRYGAALNSKQSSESSFTINGYFSTAFKAAKYIALGDEISLNLYGKSYNYKVSNITTKKTDAGENELVLSTSVSSDAFSCYNGNNLYIIAVPSSNYDDNEGVLYEQ